MAAFRGHVSQYEAVGANFNKESVYSLCMKCMFDANPILGKFTNLWLQVVEGATRLPLESTGCRKRLRSEEGEEEQEARRTWERRPNPEGSLSAGELSSYGKLEDDEEKLQRLCQRCQVMATQLNRQAAALTDTAALQVRNNGALKKCDKGLSLVKYL